MPKRKATTSIEQQTDCGADGENHSTSTPKKRVKNLKAPTTRAEDGAYTSQQKGAISEFTGVTQSDKSSAAKLLRQHGWNVGVAINAFFNNSTNGTQSSTRTNLTKIFDRYRESPNEEPNEINIEGTGRLLGELQIDLEDISALVFSEIVASPTLGKITREGFIDGWSDLSIDTLPKMRHTILQRRAELATSPELFKNVYNHTFSLALPTGSKTLPLELAVVFWRLVFSEQGYEWRSSPSGTPWLEWWVDFQESKHTKAINKDLWKQTLNFARETMKHDGLGFWSEDSSWPSVMDEFVEWVKVEKKAAGAQQANGGDAMEVE